MQSATKIDELAAHWVVREDAGPLREDERRELQSWLALDERHQGAYVRARSRWMDLERWSAVAGRAEPASAGNEPPAMEAREHFRHGWLVAGLAALAIVGAAILCTVLRPGESVYATAVGEVRRIALEDGSTLVLNTHSEVTVRLQEHRRELRLRRGEALFEVARDPARPFSVRANDVAVRALGTTFAVKLDEGKVDVTVTEGLVEVARANGERQVVPAEAANATRRVSANHRAVVVAERPPDVDAIAPKQAARLLAWQAGMVAFDGESLREAVAEVNRHNRKRIVVDDEALAAQPVVGIFRATDVEGFAQTTAMALGARTHQDGDTIHLRPAGAVRAR